MRSAILATCLWPGLPGLWLRGQWSGLAWAVSYAAMLNVALAGTFVWSGLFGQLLISALWVGVAGTWCITVWRNYQWLSGLDAPQNVLAPVEDLLPQAHAEYLRGHWFETEALVERMLRTNPHDVDARLLLATVCRHTRRFDRALSELDRLEQDVAAEKWSAEIDRERELLNRLAAREETETEKPNATNLNASQAA